MFLSLKLILRELYSRNRGFPPKVDIKGVINEKRFFKKTNDFSHVIKKIFVFPPKVDIKEVISKKRFSRKK